MRVFKTNQPVLSEADRAAALRLTNIASRYRPRAADAEAAPDAPSENPR
jgi:hypothetical protein